MAEAPCSLPCIRNCCTVATPPFVTGTHKLYAANFAFFTFIGCLVLVLSFCFFFSFYRNLKVDFHSTATHHASLFPRFRGGWRERKDRGRLGSTQAALPKSLFHLRRGLRPECQQPLSGKVSTREGAGASLAAVTNIKQSHGNETQRNVFCMKCVRAQSFAHTHLFHKHHA